MLLQMSRVFPLKNADECDKTLSTYLAVRGKGGPPDLPNDDRARGTASEMRRGRTPGPSGVAHDRASLDHLRRLKTKFRVLPRSARRETIDFGTELIEEQKTSPLAARFIDDG